MKQVGSRLALSLVAGLIVCACAPQRSPGAGSTQPTAPPPAKRIVVAIMGELSGFGPGTLGPVPGKNEVEVLANVGLTVRDDRGARRALLADTVPTVENGLWKLLPDGQMETTWTIRPGARWHDGTPLTADDLVFTVEVEQDRELPIGGNANYGALERVEALDSRTIVARWKRLFPWADSLFQSTAAGGGRFGAPLPKHLLEAHYTQDKANFINLPYWTQFVGTGPFKLREWVAGSHLVLDAFDQFALGRPRIDQIEVRFIPDGNALVASVLAGSVDLTLSRGISFD